MYSKKAPAAEENMKQLSDFHKYVVHFVLASTILILQPVEMTSAKSYQSCQENWTRNPMNGLCYYVSDNYANFEVAKKECEKSGANLLMLRNNTEHEFVLSLLHLIRAQCSQYDDCSNFWIGLRKAGTSGVVPDNPTWIDDSEVTSEFQFWEQSLVDVPNDADLCGMIDVQNILANRGNDLMYDICKKPKRYICKSICPAGLVLPPGSKKCYGIIPEKMTWRKAFDGCVASSSGANLAMIMSAEESKIVTDFVKLQFHDAATCYSGDYHRNVYWIGGQRQDPNSCITPFVWKPNYLETISMDWTNWRTGQPDCSEGYEECVHLSAGYDYQWNDENCNLFQACPLCQFIK